MEERIVNIAVMHATLQTDLDLIIMARRVIYLNSRFDTKGFDYMRIIRKIGQGLAQLKPKKKVAAYARVSVDTERMQHSLAAQVSYYSSMIQMNPEWEYAGVYADYGISGTRIKKREEFQRMISDAEEGKIDIIFTKSIQRFARNTVDLLKTVRHLKELGVEVRFEKEHINTLSGDGELMLSILASFAQEESRSISDNVKWAFKKKMKQGISPNHFFVYGYRWQGDQMVIEPEEAAVVRFMFSEYLSGKSMNEISDILYEKGYKTLYGKDRFSTTGISHMVRNEIYTGTLVLQKGFINNPIDKKRKINQGEQERYVVSNHHEPIVSMEAFKRVQEILAEKKRLGFRGNKHITKYTFSGMIKCPYCHCSYNRRKLPSGNVYWSCKAKMKKGLHCPVKGGISDTELQKAIVNILDGRLFTEVVNHLEIPDTDTVDLFFKNGNKYRFKIGGNHGTYYNRHPGKN